MNSVDNCLIRETNNEGVSRRTLKYLQWETFRRFRFSSERSTFLAFTDPWWQVSRLKSLSTEHSRPNLIIEHPLIGVVNNWEKNGDGPYGSYFIS